MDHFFIYARIAYMKICRKLFNRYIMSVCILGLFSVLFIAYQDLPVTGQFGFVLLDSLTDGEPLSFFVRAYESGITEEGAVYGITFYALEGLWDLPLWILRHFIPYAWTSPLLIIWYKLFNILFLILSVRETVRLAGMTGIDESAAVTLFLCSAAVFFPVFIASQCDIVTVFFTLCAIRCYEDGQYGRFLLLMAVAINLKPFPVFIAFLLILIRQKNVLRIIRDLLASCSLLIATNLLYRYNPWNPFIRGKAQSEHLSVFLTRIGIVSIPLFFIIAFIVCLFAYRKLTAISDNAPETERSCAVSTHVHLIGVLMGAFCIFGDAAPYWVIYLEPWWTLISLDLLREGAQPSGAQDAQSGSPALHWLKTHGVFLVTVMETALIIRMIGAYPWVYGGKETYTYTLLSPLFCHGFILENVPTLAGTLRTLRLGFLFPMAAALSALLCLVLSALLLADDTCRNKLPDSYSVKKSSAGECLLQPMKPSNGILAVSYWLRLLFIAGFILFTLLALITSWEG